MKDRDLPYFPYHHLAMAALDRLVRRGRYGRDRIGVRRIELEGGLAVWYLAIYDEARREIGRVSVREAGARLANAWAIRGLFEPASRRVAP